MRVTKEVRLMWGVRIKYEIHLPAGLKVKLAEKGPMETQDTYFLDEFPINLPLPYTSFPMDSFTRHDAIHYGIKLTADQTELICQ